MKIPAGSSLLRLRVVTGTNCSGFGGTAMVDKPVAVDPFHHLPLIPASHIKGVIAGRLGNALPGESISPERAELFGRPDTAPSEAASRPATGTAGDPGAKLVFGDALPLCFPVPTRACGACWVYPAATLSRFWKLLGHDHWKRLGGLKQGQAAGTLPVVRLPGELEQGRLTVEERALRLLHGRTLPARFVIAGCSAAEKLWRAAVEELSLTALDEGHVVDASLRRIERIPAGSLFLLFVTSCREVTLPDLTRLQLGSGDGTGSGYVSVSRVNCRPHPGPAQENCPATESIGLGGPEGESGKREYEIMERAYECLCSLATDKPGVAQKVRTVIRTFGMRWKTQGLSKTLAFSLAKAALGKDLRGAEARAHEWFLRRLLGCPEAAPAQDTLRQTAAAIIAGTAPPPVSLESHWLWLRRHSETLLDGGTSGDTDHG